MSKNLETPTKLTEFAPLQPEERPQSVGQFLSNFFKPKRIESVPIISDNVESVASWAPTDPVQVDLTEGRSLPNVLRRITSLLATKSNNLQNYGDTELKQYWMPDSVSKECYECCEKFTTFRRRHHCRVCGQIFCSQCCAQQISGKIFGCTGDLRVCNYCCKVILSYLQTTSIGITLPVELRALQDSLQGKFGGEVGEISRETSPSATSQKQPPETDSFRRKISVGYQEEKFGSDIVAVPYLSIEEKCRALQNSVSLRNLYEEIVKPLTGITFTPYKYRLRNYPECFLGSELVDWLICQQKANNRVQATALAQALLEGSYIETFSDTAAFVDGYVRYRKGNTYSSSGFTQTSTNFDLPINEEPIWVQQIPHDTSDYSDEHLSPIAAAATAVSSSSSYTLNLNLEANSVYLSRPVVESPHTSSYKCPEETTVVTSEQRELAPESGWFNASALREENGEKESYELLTEAYELHESTLRNQLLLSCELFPIWGEILAPLVTDIVTMIRPDKNHDAVDLDVRNYVKVKKLPKGTKEDTRTIYGVVCSKNVTHKHMLMEIDNPKILLLECSIVYQRTEGRLMSLEPVMMQEQEYLRHVVARIAALNPDVVLVQKNISRLAQDMLREHNITLVQNVKNTVLERLARCTEADIVPAVDAHIGRPKLGTCKRFYLKSFQNVDRKKCLMFFEGLPNPHLGATIILRGASHGELKRVKQFVNFLIFTAYNWRLEKSFLMDAFALPPPNSRGMEFLDVSRESSPLSNKLEVFASHKKIVPLQCVEDNSDPLQSTDGDIQQDLETLTVAELPFSNNFKKHLEGTILCVSPFIRFPPPYLETDAGRKCKLRKYFHKDMYFSEQFNGKVKKWKNSETIQQKLVETPMGMHRFQTAKLVNKEDVKTQNLLASFRACGGQYPKKERLDVAEEQRGEMLVEVNNHRDVLDPLNHQRLAVLFYSFSHESQNAPAFCVTPWVVYMDFYGNNDIPLGCFLERYCFRPSYACPSKNCSTPMVKHIRRFVHNSGSVTISLNNFEDEYAEEDIVMWSWCTQCTSVSPVVPLSADTWSYSFAKYLEMRFHGEIYNRRGQSPCEHSLHQDHYHYFGYKSYVASFKYSPIKIWEISLPSQIIDTAMVQYQSVIVDEVKMLAEKGCDLFNLVQDKVVAMIGEEFEGVGNVRQILARELGEFKLKVDEVQMKLTSPSMEFDRKMSLQSYWKIQDSIFRLKSTISELADRWNVHLKDAKSKTVEDVEGGLEESGEDDQETLKKKETSAKNLLDKFLRSPAQNHLIPQQFPSQEHYNLPTGMYGLIPVFEGEPSSIIAHALNSLQTKTEEFDSPSVRRRVDSGKTDDSSSGILGFLRPKDSEDVDQLTMDEPTSKKKSSSIVIQFQDSSCNFFCRIYLAEAFSSLRNSILALGEESYIRSLSRCVQWKAVGGKSGSSFYKTADDRFILKNMPKNEVQMFLGVSTNYFSYLNKCLTSGQPTLLGKIVGIYEIIYKNAAHVGNRTHLLVMENLFYNRNVSQKFDLKGSERNRLVDPDNRDQGEIVFLDENLLKMSCDNPIYVLPHSKDVLLAAIQNDTEFLANQTVVDYSLLVGLDSNNNELVLGIIDYIRLFTWDKKLETIVKMSGILGGQGKLPTIISPEDYQKRFIEAMHRYFLQVPDHFAGLGKGLDV